MRISLFLLLAPAILLSASGRLYSQVTQSNAISEQMAGTMSCESGENAIGHNPAGTYCAPMALGVSYINRFGLKETSQKGFMGALPIMGGVLSAQYNYYGFQLYNQTQALLGYAMPLGERLSAGIHLGYHHIHIDDTPENGNAISGDIGIQYRINGDWSLGSWVSNITNSQYSESDTIIPVRIQAGIRRTFYGGHSASIDVAKSTLHDAIEIHAGISAHLNDYVRVAVGLSTQPLTIGAGTEIIIQGFHLQFSARHDEHLGWIPSAGVVWTRERSSEKLGKE